MSNTAQEAETRYRRMQSLVTVLQHLNKDVDLHEERYDTLEELREHLPTVDEIRLYMFNKPSPH
ncbi:hypothetical protein [Maribacter sp. ACAM166]|uniref:hypothetical protein n=1 Tax=Maribacter sp. ACAM166 TaxID=2508996 RepID=UPI0010FECC56|nr:hypothetical protein [Maribacter sp. ACAM166]TLP81372.1 hypothetical protein ES765_05020 [Maribacter sp. ACAM166]